MKKLKKIIQERKFKYIAFFGLIISIQFIVGGNLQYKGYSVHTIKEFIIDVIKIIILWIILIAVHYCILFVIKKIKIKISQKKNENNVKCKKEQNENNVKNNTELRNMQNENSNENNEKLKKEQNENNIECNAKLEDSKIESQIKNNKKLIKRKNKDCKKITDANEKNGKIYSYFIIIFACWIPVLLAFFPACVSYDGGMQIYTYVFKGSIGYHPFLTTYLFSFFYKLGLFVFNSPTFGMFLFSLFQMTIMAFCFAYAVEFIKNKTIEKGKFIYILSLIFYALFPYNQLMPIITTKDTLFAGIFIVFMIKLYNYLDYKKFKFKEYIIMLLFGLLTLFLRNNITYAYALSIPFIFIILFKNKKKMFEIVSMFLIILIIYKEVNPLVYSNNNGEKSVGIGRKALYTQAIGRIVKYRSEELTDDEKEKIQYYFDGNNEKIRKYLINYKIVGRLYRSNFADNTDIMANHKKINEKRFYELYFHLLKRFPTECIDSFLDTIRGYWYINDDSFCNLWPTKADRGALELFNNPNDILKNEFAIIGDSKIPWLKTFYKKLLCENYFRKIPILFVFFQPAFYFYIDLAFLLYALYNKKEKKRLVLAVILFILFMSCFAAYCAIVRYMYEILVFTPVMLALAFTKEDE